MQGLALNTSVQTYSDLDDCWPLGIVSAFLFHQFVSRDIVQTSSTFLIFYLSLLHSRFLCRHATLLPTGELRDDTKNGCVADFFYLWWLFNIRSPWDVYTPHFSVPPSPFHSVSLPLKPDRRENGAQFWSPHRECETRVHLVTRMTPPGPRGHWLQMIFDRL